MKKFLYITFTLLALSACKNTSTSDKQEKEGITILQDSIKTLTSSNFENVVTDDPNPELVAIVKDALQKVDSLYKEKKIGSTLTFLKTASPKLLSKQVSSLTTNLM